MVYVREAHAVDGYLPAFGAEDPVVEEPIHIEERQAVASQCLSVLGLDRPDVLAELFAMPLHPKRVTDSRRLLFLAGATVAFVVDGGHPEVAAAHARIDGLSLIHI